MYKHIQDSRNGLIQIFTASMADIQKALEPKSQMSLEQIRELLPSVYRHQLAAFDQNKAQKLPPHRPGINYRIELLKKDGKDPEVP